MKSAAQPSLSGVQLVPPSVDSKTPPIEIAMYRWRGSRGSTSIECRNSPSGVAWAAHARSSGSQPEDPLDRACLLAVGGLAERGRRGRFTPAAAAVGRAHHRRSQVSGPGRDQQHARLARILHDVVNDVTQELRAGELPAAATLVRAQREQALARADPECICHAGKHPRGLAPLSTAAPRRSRAAPLPRPRFLRLSRAGR